MMWQHPTPTPAPPSPLMAFDECDIISTLYWGDYATTLRTKQVVQRRDRAIVRFTANTRLPVMVADELVYVSNAYSNPFKLHIHGPPEPVRAALRRYNIAPMHRRGSEGDVYMTLEFMLTSKNGERGRVYA